MAIIKGLGRAVRGGKKAVRNLAINKRAIKNQVSDTVSSAQRATSKISDGQMSFGAEGISDSAGKQVTKFAPNAPDTRFDNWPARQAPGVATPVDNTLVGGKQMNISEWQTAESRKGLNNKINARTTVRQTNIQNPRVTKENYNAMQAEKGAFNQRGQGKSEAKQINWQVDQFQKESSGATSFFGLGGKGGKFSNQEAADAITDIGPSANKIDRGAIKNQIAARQKEGTPAGSSWFNTTDAGTNTRMGTTESSLTRKYATETAETGKVFDSGNLNEATLRKRATAHRLNPESTEDFVKKSLDGDTTGAMGVLDAHKKDFASNPTFMDSMNAHHVPALAGGGVGLAFLVNQMSAKKGRQSNAELYGQRSPYQ